MSETLFELEALAEKAKGRVELQRATEKLMRWAAEEGWPLSKLTNPKVMNRSLRTLKKRARQFSLSFSDYTPRKLKGGKNA